MLVAALIDEIGDDDAFVDVDVDVVKARCNSNLGRAPQTRVVPGAECGIVCVDTQEAGARSALDAECRRAGRASGHLRQVCIVCRPEFPCDHWDRDSP